MLYEHFFPILERFAARRGVDDPELLASRVLLRVLDKVDGIDGCDIDSFRAYLFQASSSAPRGSTSCSMN